MPQYAVCERAYSWGTLVELFRDGRLVMFADLYRDGTYHVYERAEIFGTLIPVH